MNRSRRTRVRAILPGGSRRPGYASVQRLSWMNMKEALFLMFASLSFWTSVCAQGKVMEPLVIKGNASACEANAASFDILANILRSGDERLFVIARLGMGETSRDLNRRRLHNVRTYFKDGWPNVETKIVFGEGDRVEGEGRVEFYVGSTLLQISLIKRGGDICVDCCEYPDNRYYGAGKRDRPKAKRQ
jgi:hypothetical protein